MPTILSKFSVCWTICLFRKNNLLKCPLFCFMIHDIWYTGMVRIRSCPQFCSPTFCWHFRYIIGDMFDNVDSELSVNLFLSNLIVGFRTVVDLYSRSMPASEGWLITSSTIRSNHKKCMPFKLEGMQPLSSLFVFGAVQTTSMHILNGFYEVKRIQSSDLVCHFSLCATTNCCWA